MEHPIVNPPNPYVGNLRVFPGTLVKVSGRPRPNATRFAINFQTGPSLNPRDDLALHLSPCFTPPRVVRNSLIQGQWGIEESWSSGAVVSPHSPVEIMILAENEQFKIAINGSHYCEYRHRIPYHQITHLTIDGDFDIERITITSSEYTPSFAPSAPVDPSPPYPSSGRMPMPMPTPAMYPSLGPSQPPSHYPAAPVGPSPPAGPAPAPASYASGYPQSGPYPPPSGPQPYPMPPSGGPAPAPSGYYGGYPQAPPPHQAPYQPQPQPGYPQPQPGQSSSSPFGSLPIGGKALGTIAGLGLGAAAGAAALSALNPLKTMKKVMKPKKMFKHKGWGGRSSSSSNSSRSSISSRSSFSSDTS